MLSHRPTSLACDKSTTATHALEFLSLVLRFTTIDSQSGFGIPQVRKLRMQRFYIHADAFSVREESKEFGYPS